MKSVILEDSKCLHEFYIVPACYFERLAVKMWNCDREEPHSVICEQVFFPSWFCKKNWRGYSRRLLFSFGRHAITLFYFSEVISILQ